MKITITEINDGGGARYFMSQASTVGNLPVGRIGAMVTVEINDPDAQRLLDRQGDAARLQVDLREIFTSGTLKDMRFIGRLL